MRDAWSVLEVLEVAKERLKDSKKYAGGEMGTEEQNSRLELPWACFERRRRQC